MHPGLLALRQAVLSEHEVAQNGRSRTAETAEVAATISTMLLSIRQILDESVAWRLRRQPRENEMREQDKHMSEMPLSAAADMPPEAQARYSAFMQRKVTQLQQELLQIDAYQARIEKLDASMTARLHELTVGVFWPHRAADLDLMLELGTGYVALDEIDRPLSSAMSCRVGDDYAMLGMMVTTPRLQAQGTGRRLLRRVMADCLGRDLRLSATRSGYRLYQDAGFVPVGLIYQHQGVVRPIHAPAPMSGLEIRPFDPHTDLAALRALDTHAYGAARDVMMDAFLARSETVVAWRDGAMAGFGSMRNFGKGKVIGPLVAEQDEMAMHLAAHFLMQNAGQFIRLDTLVQSERFGAFLAAAGMGVFDTVTEMRLGRLRRAITGPLTYGLAMQSLG
ncbi:GNAT family N-acetyltransferase [Rhodobacteraceae bacterium]|nr:GNAT family N-acetyltransferase [Paracoccaceae bacterium]